MSQLRPKGDVRHRQEKRRTLECRRRNKQHVQGPMGEKEHGACQQVLSAWDGDFVEWNCQIRSQSALREHVGPYNT